MGVSFLLKICTVILHKKNNVSMSELIGKLIKEFEKIVYWMPVINLIAF